MKVYKVVRKTFDGHLLSLRNDLPSEDTVVYKPGQWVSARFGPIFAYDTPKPTVCMRPIEKWSAEAVVCKHPIPKYILNTSALRDRLVGRFWRFWHNMGRTAFLPEYTRIPVPPGTVLCDKIKLIERVEVKDENQRYTQTTKAAEAA